MKHGANVKRCSSEGCNNYAKRGGVCMKHGANVKLCSSDKCTNQAQNGGVCFKHGAMKKLCSSEGCTNQVQKRGVCWRHGAFRNPRDESTDFAQSLVSAFERTTATLPNQRSSVALSSQETGSVPVVVTVCGVVATEEV